MSRSAPIQNEYMPDYVSPPGETLKETLDALGMAQAELAKRTGRAKKTINEIIMGKAPITPKVALELEKVLGGPAGFWNSLESHYRESLARREEQNHLQEHLEWLKAIPVRAMVKPGWIQPFRDKIQQLQELLKFFGISSPDQWENLAESYVGQVVFRKSEAFQSNPAALIAWLRRGQIEAKHIPCAPYDSRKFRAALQSIRLLVSEDPKVFEPEMVRLCAASGVAVVFVPELPKTHVSAATRWLTPNKALIQLSLRYKTDDHLWFSFFHEAGHLVLHGKKDVFLDGSQVGGDGTKEQEANRFAANLLISQVEFRAFVKAGRLTKEAIRRFASDIGIAPGVVVGRLQHDGILPRSHCNDLKRRFDWADQQQD